MVLNPVRGTHDLLPEDCLRHRFVSNVGRHVSQIYGFEEIETPIFEFTPVFYHMGETSDVVSKETYTFTDRGDQEITLRPEGTAGVVRAVISNGLTQSMPLKYFYSGPMFRYDRPQKGRYRQFHQFGIELLGVESALADVEAIALANQFLSELNLNGGFTLELNSLGDSESRGKFRSSLVEYLNDFRDRLSKESQERLAVNPLRVLDSKDETDKKIVAKAPIYREYLTTQSEDMFAEVLRQLDLLNIKYHLNYTIVRGLDYYCHTTYEFVSNELGAQGTILAGGRYDGLIKIMGGPDIPGTGWAAGIERLTLLLNSTICKERPITLIPLGKEAEDKSLVLIQELRKQGLCVEMGYSGSMTKRLKRANKNNVRWAVIMGDDEIKENKVIVRDLETGEQTDVARDKVEAFFLKVC